MSVRALAPGFDFHAPAKVQAQLAGIADSAEHESELAADAAAAFAGAGSEPANRDRNTSVVGIESVDGGGSDFGGSASEGADGHHGSISQRGSPGPDVRARRRRDDHDEHHDGEHGEPEGEHHDGGEDDEDLEMRTATSRSSAMGLRDSRGSSVAGSVAGSVV